MDGRTAAVVADRRIRIRWGAETRRATGGLETLPDFIALRRDEQGRPIIPRTRVTALVEAQQAWGSELGTLDAVTATIVAGKLVMPKVALPRSRCFCGTTRHGKRIRRPRRPSARLELNG